jgi:SAM-dependent methyltransferase
VFRYWVGVLSVRKLEECDVDLKEDGLVEPGAHWYYVTKARAIESLAARFAPSARSLLDVGAGSGFFAKALLVSSLLALREATCVDPNYAEERNEGPLAFRMSLPDRPADLILLLDVLEHVPDDQALLSGAIERLAPGGVVIITVPAFMSLWSNHDVYLEHFRRYRLQHVVDLAEASGLDVLTKRYLFGALFPAALLLRKLFGSRNEKAGSDLRPVHPAIDKSLRMWFRFEHSVIPQRAVGLTAVVVARKQ